VLSKETLLAQKLHRQCGALHAAPKCKCGVVQLVLDADFSIQHVKIRKVLGFWIVCTVCGLQGGSSCDGASAVHTDMIFSCWKHDVLGACGFKSQNPCIWLTIPRHKSSVLV